MENKILIVTKNEKEIIAQFPMEQLEKAYACYHQWLERDIEVEFQGPHILSGLMNGLKMSPQDLEEYKASMLQELEDHDSCCRQS